MKFRLFPSFFTVIIGVFILFTTACKIDYIWHDDVKKFVDDGLAIPIFTAPLYTGTDLPAISDKKMFQIGMPYTASIAVSNPKKIALDYRVRTKTPALFDGITDDVVATGKLKASSDTVTFSFLLNSSADKNDIEFYLDVWSAMRSYETPKMDTIWVNARPTRIIPQKKAASGALSDTDILEPDFSGTFATIYWSYPLTGTNTDIAKVKVLYTVNGVPGEKEINLDPASGKFGDNSCSVPDVPSGATVEFSVTVYDSEGLGSEAVATGNFVPQKAAAPTFSRDVGINRNKIIVTASPGTRLFCRRDNSAFTEVSSPHIIDLVTSHVVQAYTTQYGLLDSNTISPGYPNYLAQYVVSFDTDGGNTIPSVLATYGERIPEPANPTQAGQVFGVWRLNSVSGALWNFNNNFTSQNDITLYVDWTDYTVTLIFHFEGGSVMRGPLDLYETTPTAGDELPTASNMNGSNGTNNFGGWWTLQNGAGIEFTPTTSATIVLDTYYSASSASGTIDLYALWDMNPFYTVSFMPSGGSAVDPQTRQAGALVSVPAIPVRPGYIFDGWYQNVDMTGLPWNFASDFVPADNMTLYAKWGSPISFDINYNYLDGGTNNPANPPDYTVVTSTISLQSPSRPGYTFAGWYSDSAFITKVTSIPSGSTGIINLYAAWMGATASAVTIRLNNPTDTNAVLMNEVTTEIIGGTLILRRGSSVSVRPYGDSYNMYQWTLQGVGTTPIPSLSGTSYEILTLNTNAGTSLAVFTATLFFGNGGYQYSKSFSVQVTD